MMSTRPGGPVPAPPLAIVAGLVLGIAGALTLTGCGETQSRRLRFDTRPVITFGFLPYADRNRMKALFDCLSEYMGHDLDAEIRFVLSPDYETMGKLMGDRRIDLVWFTPASYGKVGRACGARILCKPYRRGQSFYRSTFVVGAGSRYRTLADLRGARFAYVERNSTSGFVMPNRMLARAGFPEPLAFFDDVSFTHNHVESLAGIHSGTYDGAAVYEGAHLQVEPPMKPEDFKIIAVSGEIPNDPICVRQDMDEAQARKIQQLFLEMHETAGGRKALARLEEQEGITRFLSASDGEYDF